MTTSRRPEWLVPTGLILLAMVPIVAGGFRLTQLATGATITEDNARFFASPAPVIIHIITAILFCVLGALQFVPSLRRRRWHRIAGRVAAPAGILAAISGLWMTLAYDSPAGDEPLLVAARLVFGTAMAVFIVLAVLAIRRRDIAQHSAWMTRGYAIGIAAGTQVLTTLPWVAIFGTPDQTTSSLLLIAGWVINLAIAEVIIVRRRASAQRSPRTTASPSPADALL